jgi:hypothetical protein
LDQPKAGYGTAFVSSEQIEDTVRQLKEVVSVRAVLSPSGSVDELHVLTSSTRAPKQIARDVETAVFAHLGVPLDYRKISIAQAKLSFPGKSNGYSGSADSGRLRLQDVNMSVQGSHAEATVHLRRGPDILTGIASGHASSHNQLRLIATATVRAVDDTRSEDGSLVVEDLNAQVALAGRQAVVVLVSAIADRGEEVLTGCALIRQDVWKAVASASLDAINRRLAIAGEINDEL